MSPAGDFSSLELCECRRAASGQELGGPRRPARVPPPGSAAPDITAREAGSGEGGGEEARRPGGRRRPSRPSPSFKTAGASPRAQPAPASRRPRPVWIFSATLWLFIPLWTFQLPLGLHCPVNMLVILAFIIVLHIICAALLFISTINNAWWVGEDFSADIWRVCINNTNCTEINDLSGSDGFTDYSIMQAVQATMILSTILCSLSFLIFLLQLFRLKQGERFILTAIIQLMSCLCVMIGASIYTDRRQDLHQQNYKVYYLTQEGSYGYSFILAWVSFSFTFISGLMYMILRKRK